MPLAAAPISARALVLLLLLCSTCVTSIQFNWNLQAAPRTFWLDQTCIQRGFTLQTVEESLNISSIGAKRTVNLNDQYQAWIYNKTFKTERDFALGNDLWTETWNVVEVESWIGAMNPEPSRDNADVRIYCDNDARWTRVPDDPVSMAWGFPANSLRIFGHDAEYEDLTNFMRRETWNEGCQDENTLGVTYESEIPRDSDIRVPTDYHSRRQTITICEVAFEARVKAFADIPPWGWRWSRTDILNVIPSSILLYQLLGLYPYNVRADVGVNFNQADTWANMLGKKDYQLRGQPAPYMWNALLAYAASLGWGVQRDLSDPQYSSGRDLFRYEHALLNPAFRPGGPITLPPWLRLPARP